MFFIPLVLGLAAGGRLTGGTMLLTGSAAAAFLAREPFMAWWRCWRRGQQNLVAQRAAVVYGGVSVACGAALLPDFPWLAVLGLVGAGVFVSGAELAMRGEGRRIAPELMAIATSMLLAPAAWYVSTGRLDTTALLLWTLCFGYFAGTVFYVRMRLAQARARDAAAPARTRRLCTLYHLGTAATLALMVACCIPVVVALSFAPVLARAFWYAARPSPTVNLKQVGWSEVAYSLWFLAAAAVGLR